MEIRKCCCRLAARHWRTERRVRRLDPIQQGALAICGFGWRGEVMENAELDQDGEVWHQEASAAS